MDGGRFGGGTVGISRECRAKMTDTESSERTPEFSLIVTTKDRTRELADLLQSLDRQRFRSFELIVSDQNADDRLLPVLAPFRQQFPLRHIRSAGGASRT